MLKFYQKVWEDVHTDYFIKLMLLDILHIKYFLKAYLGEKKHILSLYINIK